MDKNQFQQLLKQTLDQEIEEVKLWPQIEQQLPARQPIRRQRQLVRAAVVAAILILTATVAYGFYQRILAGDPGVRADLLTFIGETKSINSTDEQITVTLDYVYADANRITISYTVQGTVPADKRMMAYSNPTLMTVDGQLIDSRLMLGANEQNQENNGENGHYLSHSTFNFVPVGIAPQEQLSLKLMVDVATSNLDSGEFPAPGMEMAGSVEFAFDVPFISGDVIEIDQTATNHDVEIELQRMVVTPSMLRLEMCYDLPPLQGAFGWSPSITVQHEDDIVFAGAAETFGIPVTYDVNSHCRGIVIPKSQTQYSGKWQIVIQNFSDFSGEYKTPIEGTWALTFNVP